MSEEQKDLTKKEKEKIEEMITSLIDSEIEVAVSRATNDKIRKIIMDAFEVFDLNSYDLVSHVENSTAYSTTKVTLVKGNKITYDVDKLKKALGKKRSQMFLSKNFTLSNVKEFKELLDEYGVPSKEVKKYITKTESVNEASIGRAYEVGELDVKEIKDCYTVTPRTPYLRITSQKKEISDE